MSNKIRHEGVIESIEGSHLRVRILQSGACASCKVAAHCNASETKEKMIDIEDTQADAYTVGQAVTVSTTPRIGLMAALYAYAIPLVIMVGVIIMATALTGDELTGALAGLAVLIPYYLCVYLLRGKIRSMVYFEIETSKNNN